MDLLAGLKLEMTGPLVAVGLVALAAGLALTALAHGRPLSRSRPVDVGAGLGRLKAGFNQMVTGLRDRQRIHDDGATRGELVARSGH